MKEILILSGKGGTGKTSLLAAFATLAENAVLADCDVDAADLHLLLPPTVKREERFRAGREAFIRQEACVRCGACAAKCRFDAVEEREIAPGETCYAIRPLACEGCGVCVEVCAARAIDFPEVECGTWRVSETRAGLMAHARLDPGGENSGKLVTRVRDEARRLAEENGAALILIDGPPGVGCPVIASLSAVSLAVIVTEPTVSGEHDLLRVLELAEHFRVPAAVCVNKWDLHPAMAERIEAKAAERGARAVGRVRYDPAFTEAMLAQTTVAELSDSATTGEVRAVWESIRHLLDTEGNA